MATNKIIGPMAVSILAAGCVSATLNYSPPSEPKITNSTLADENFDIVWDRLVQRLSADFFVINNVEKASRIINVSFSVEQPNDYINCGHTSRSFTNPQGTQHYNYAVADSSAYTTVHNNNRVAFNVNRATNLEGRVNVYVAPEGDKTRVTVNARYVLNIKLRTSSFTGQPLGNETITHSF